MSQQTEAAAGDAYLSVIEVATFLGCSRPHVYRLIDRKAFPSIDISAPGSTRTKLRVRRSDLEAYVKAP